MSDAPHHRDPVAETQARQRHASDPRQSVWVSANAGAGKTRVLTERVARLLFHGTKPERILCLTYTKAAAAEMANRLYNQLGAWSTMPDAELGAALEELEQGPVAAPARERARRLFALALETPGGLKIDTIHAFAQSVLRRFPVEAGLPPHFALMDEREAAELLAEARAGMLLRGQNDPVLGGALALVIERLGEMDFDALLGEIRANRRAILTLLQDSGFPSLEAAAAWIATRLNLGAGETAASIRAEAMSPDTLPEGALKAAIGVLREGKKSDGDMAGRLHAALALADPGARFDAYLQAFLTKEGKPRDRLATKGLGDAHPETAALLSTEQVRMIEAAKRVSAAEAAALSTAALRIAEAVLADYERRKQARALLDYEDLIERTGALLDDPGAPWVLYKLDGGIEHILVDEAQDTAPEQWDIVAALWGEFFAGQGRHGPGARTVFVVGDEKQSIYSFQGADPMAFGTMQARLRAGAQAVGAPLEPVDLALSFRSSGAVLEAVDRVFNAPPVAGAFIGTQTQTRHLARRAEAAGLVELNPVERGSETEESEAWDAPLDYPGTGDPEVRLAARIAGRIQSWLADRLPIPAREGRAIRPGDIMILVQRRNAFFEEMIRALKAAGVPVAGADRLRILEQIGVQDLLALGRVALLPEDDLSLAEVLKSPLCGLDEEALFALAYPRTGSLWAALQARKGDRDDFGRAAEFLEKARARADTRPVFDFYAEVLGAFGGRDRLLARLGPEAADPLEEFEGLALAYERLHPPSLQGFLHWVTSGSAEIKRDLEHAGGEVRVMTVHGAKGLEAPIVILPDTCRVPSRQHDPRLLQPAGRQPGTNEPPALFWRHKAPLEDPVTEAARQERDDRRWAEYWRLLYVAMTRAEDRLHVYGYAGRNAVNPSSWYELIAAALEGEPEEADGEGGTRRVLRSGQPLGEAEPETARQITPAPPLPAWARQPARAEPVALRLAPPSAALAAGEQPARGPFEGADAGRRFLRGTLIHRLLEILPELPQAARAAAARRYLTQPALALDGDLAAEIEAETLRVLAAPEFAALFGPGSRAEMAVAGRVAAWGGAYLSGRVDRIVIEPARVRLLDFKTNRPPPETPEAIAPAYLVQLAGYRALLEGIYPGRPVETALLWTDGPRLMAVPDALLDGALASAVPAKDGRKGLLDGAESRS